MFVGHPSTASDGYIVVAPAAVSVVCQVPGSVLLLHGNESLCTAAIGTDQVQSSLMRAFPVPRVTDPKGAALSLDSEELLLRPARLRGRYGLVVPTWMVLTSLCHGSTFHQSSDSPRRSVHDGHEHHPTTAVQLASCSRIFAGGVRPVQSAHRPNRTAQSSHRLIAWTTLKRSIRNLLRFMQ